jgi:CopG family transcriptional regulator/antitoxin EndoAI
MSRVSKVLSLSLPPALSREATKIAKEESRTKSELFREALRQYVSRRRWGKIRVWGAQSVAKSNIREEDIPSIVRDVRKGG